MRYRLLAMTLTAALLPLLLTACADDFMVGLHRTALKLTAQTEEQVTRAAANIQGSSFDANQEIVAYIRDTNGNPIEDGSGTPHCPAFFTTSSPDEDTHLNILTHTPQLYYPTDDEHINIRAYYPSTVRDDQTTFSVQTNQATGTVAATEAQYKKSDLMFAKVDDQARTSGTVNLNFQHKMVKFIFNVVADGDIDIDECYLKGVETTVGFDPETGAVTNLSGAARNITDIKLDNGGAVVIPPQELSGEFISVRGTARQQGDPTLTDSEAKFSLKYEASAGGALTTRQLESGKVYTVNLSVGYDNFGKTYEIGKWDDNAGIISVASYGSAGFSIDNASIYADDDYTHTDEGYSYTGSAINVKPVVKYGASKTLTLNEHYQLQYFNNVHAGKATVLAIGIGSYEGYAVAASFNITQIPSTLQYSKENGTVMESLTKEYVRNYTINPRSETFKDIHLDIDGNGTMSYAISRKAGDTTTDVTKVASIDAETGVITLQGTGSVKVTATMAADKDYQSSSTSFILNVNAREYDSSSGNIRAYFTEQGPTGGSPTYTYDGREHKPAITVEDKVGDTWVQINSFTPTYPDGGVDANESARVLVNLTAPYNGVIPLTYTIKKAKPNLRIYEGGTTSTNLLSPQTKILYLASLNTTNTTTCSRTRIATTDFGTATFKPKSGTNSLFTVTETTATGAGNSTSGYDKNTTGVFKSSNTSTGNITYLAYVEGNKNYEEASVEFQVQVIPGYEEFAYTGGTQTFTCKAPGTYLLEAWGAQGGNIPESYTAATSTGGGGAYVKAEATLTKDRVLYINVGQGGLTKDVGYSPYKSVSDGGEGIATNAIPAGTTSGQTGTVVVRCNGWNGGGAVVWGLNHSVAAGVDYWTATDPLCGGGGATDISLSWSGAADKWNTLEHLLTRILVAGGGGGALYYSRESGAGNGGGGGAWEGQNGGGTDDPGEGGTLYRGGISALSSIAKASWTNHSAIDTYYNNSTTTSMTSHYDSRPGNGSGSCGIFGQGGYYTCVAEGGGAGGGGWYGGGACGQGAGNGGGAGGSSYAWTEAMSTHYPTLSSLTSQGFITYHYGSGSSALKTPKDLGFPYLKNASATAGQNTSETRTPANGYVHITCLSTTN